MKQWKNVPCWSEKWFKRKISFEERCWYTLLKSVMPVSWICLNLSVSKYASICITCEYAWICVKHYVPGSNYVWICSIKIQNIHELFLSSVWNRLNMWTVLSIHAWISYENLYTWIWLTIPGFWICLNLPKHTLMWANTARYV